MARVLVTGSTTGLGLAAAQALLDAGHSVIVHARNDERAAGLGPLARASAGVVIADLDDLDWDDHPWNGVHAYCDSKLLATTLAAAVARYWPDVRTNTVDPGWVPTRMGGPGATDDLELGHDTQVWLATSDDRAAATTGEYWYHHRTQRPAPIVLDHVFQDALVDALSHMTGEHLIRCPH